jgi:predicted RecB family nuclease
MTYITASHLYNYLQCPHRVWRDKYGPQNEKDPEPNPFVELLWDKGVAHESNVVLSLGDLVDLSSGSREQRFEKTISEMKKGTPLIYQGVLIFENLLGIPDLLKNNGDGTYIPVDIKSGSGFEGVEEEGDEKYKKHYALQLCHYLEILKKLGFAVSDKARIIDVHNQEIVYDLQNEIGIKNKNTWWQFYYEVRNEVELLLANKIQNKPAMAGVCKLCPWYKSCKTWAKDTHDLTTVFYLGRAKRDRLNEDLGIEKVEDIADINVAEVMERKAKDKKFLVGIAEKTLSKIIQRAFILNNNSKPVIYKQLGFPQKNYELYFDIEDDPTQEVVYMHGVYERSPNGERFVPFVAVDTTPEAEKNAWSEFWQYIRSLPKNDFAVYYYSQHEKTIYKKMRELYPDVVTEEELEAFFDKETAVDLYSHIILPYTDWPLSSYSVKEIAQYLGFKWRDETPSGALSIQWYNEYLKDKDPKKMQRILDYNEDDCKATVVIKDYLVNSQMESTK